MAAEGSGWPTDSKIRTRIYRRGEIERQFFNIGRKNQPRGPITIGKPNASAVNDHPTARMALITGEIIVWNRQANDDVGTPGRGFVWVSPNIPL